MNRRGLIGMFALLALAAFTGTSVRAVESSPGAKSACVCCGSDCACEACRCDAGVKAGEACDCCQGAACCVAETETATSAVAVAATAAARTAKSTQGKSGSACDCCGTDCACEACACQAKAGEPCECCDEAECCSADAVTTAKACHSERTNAHARLSQAYRSAKTAKSVCDCCGTDCGCDLCACDAKAKAGEPCDCCDGSECCSTGAVTTEKAPPKAEKLGMACGKATAKQAGAVANR